MRNFPSFYDVKLKNFVGFLLVIDPKDRPSFDKIGKHEIFDDF